MPPVTRDTVVIGVSPRINPIKFGEVLLAAGSQAFGEAPAMYSTIVNEGVCPAFLLAVFKKESRYATDPASIVVRYQTFNMGNCRSSRIGVTDTITDPVRGTFIKYKNFATGARDAAHRLVDKIFNYARAGATTIEQIISIWAPPAENDTEKYIADVILSMNQWIGGSAMTIIPTQEDIGFPVRLHWAFDSGPARALSTVNTFVVHDTEGNMASDEPVLTANDSNIASCHALIAPDGELVFMVPLGLTAWTPGNDAVAEKSINVEISGFQSKGYTDAQYRSVAAFFNWCVAQGCPIPATYVGKSGTAGIIGHQDVPNPDQPGKFGGVSGHTDPGPLFDWAKLVQLCKGGSQSVTQPTKEPDVIFIPETGRSLGFGFKSFWQGLDRLGDNYNLLVMGYPVSNEFDIVFSDDATTGKKHTVQLFQRSGLINETENPAPWDNHPMTLSQLMEAYDYAVANNLITADTRTAYMKWRDSNVERLTSWGEVLDNTFVRFGQDGGGYTTAELKTLHDMVVAMRAGQTFDQYQAAAAAQPHN